MTHTPAEHTHEYEPAQIGPTCKHCGLLKSTIEAHTPAGPEPGESKSVSRTTYQMTGKITSVRKGRPDSADHSDEVELDPAPAEPETCPKCKGSGKMPYPRPYPRGPVKGKFTFMQDAICTWCNGTGTVEPGPPTSSESPQTLGVTADPGTDTDEGGPGTIEGATQGEFEKTLSTLAGSPLKSFERERLLATHEADCTQREKAAYKQGWDSAGGEFGDEAIAQAVREELEWLYMRGHIAERASVAQAKDPGVFDQPDWAIITAPIFYCFKITIEERISQLRATGTERRPDEN